MIIIWDNGRDYSDHALYFFEIDSLPEVDVVEALKTLHEDGEVIAHTYSINWREGRQTTRLAAHLSPGNFFDCWCDSDFEREMRSGPVPKREDAVLVTDAEAGQPQKMYWYLYPKNLDHLSKEVFEHLLPMWRKAEWIGNWGKQVDLLEQYFKEKT